jgi:hypothetical protein
MLVKPELGSILPAVLISELVLEGKSDIETAAQR